MAKAKDCEYIFLDHVTAFADGIGDINKVNQLTRNYVLQLANLTRELDIGLFTISHLRKSEGKTPHEEGGRVHLDDLYGAAALKQWVSFAIGLERNQQADNVDERHTTTLRVLKDRYSGQATGNIVSIKYDENTGRLMEVADLAVAEFTQEDERY
jgi:twinkle protein